MRNMIPVLLVVLRLVETFVANYGKHCWGVGRERVYFFASTRVTEKKKNNNNNNYTYSSNSTVTHNTMICAQWQEAPKNR